MAQAEIYQEGVDFVFHCKGDKIACTLDGGYFASLESACVRMGMHLSTSHFGEKVEVTLNVRW